MNYCPLVCASVLYQMRICGQAVGNNHLSQRSYNSLKVVHDSTLWRNGYLSSFQPYLGFCLFARILSQFPQGMFQTVDLSESLASCWQSRHASVEKGSRNDCLWSQSQREREGERFVGPQHLGFAYGQGKGKFRIGKLCPCPLTSTLGAELSLSSVLSLFPGAPSEKYSRMDCSNKGRQEIEKSCLHMNP